MRLLQTMLSLVVAGALLAGCADEAKEKKKPGLEERQAEWSEGQKKALNDPMNYRPEMDRTDVSGGGIMDFDREGFKRDMKAWTLD